MSGVKLFCIIVALPALAVLGHDIYKGVNFTDLTVTENFHFSDFGWLFVTYFPKAYQALADAISPEKWDQFVKPLLAQKGVVVTGGVAAAIYAILFVLKKLRVWPFAVAGASLFAFGAKTSKPVRYKRLKP